MVFAVAPVVVFVFGCDDVSDSRADDAADDRVGVSVVGAARRGEEARGQKDKCKVTKFEKDHGE